MRLVNCRTLELEEFFGRPVPPYYILSHRWTDDEVSYQDFKKGRKTESEGYKKIVDCCSFVLSRHHADNPECYVWIDTCCIDKKSSAELSEAINSMFKWYANAMCCYAHLFDVSLENFRIPRTALLQGLEPWSEDEHDDCNGIEEFRNSSWLTRGWTLQELLAPDIVVFVDVGWKVLGHKCQIYLNYPCERKTILDRDHLTELLSWITGIDCLYLDNSYEIRNASIACRMSWASSRSTTRVEDTAYCLLGIMGVNMPLLYGEGEMAFFRLQEELVKRSTDHSIFAWAPSQSEGYDRVAHEYEIVTTRVSGIFARSPANFDRSGKIRTLQADAWPYTITNTGLDLRAVATRGRARLYTAISDQREMWIVRLNCALATAKRRSEDIHDPEENAMKRNPAAIVLVGPYESERWEHEGLAAVKIFERLHDFEVREASPGDGKKAVQPSLQPWYTSAESRAVIHVGSNEPEQIQLYVRTFDKVTAMIEVD